VTPSFESTNTDVSYGSRNRSRVLEHDWTVYPVQGDTVQSNFQSAQHHAAIENPEVNSATIVPQIVVGTDASAQIVDSNAVRNRFLGAAAEEMFENSPRHLLSYLSDSSTTLPDPAFGRFRGRAVKAEVQRLFSLATFVEFESGMTNDFSDGLEEAIETFGEVALEHVQEFVLDEKIPFTIAAETLRYIGNTESERYAEGRRKLLEACLLNSRFMLVRDGAAAGLSYMEDSNSIPCLMRAIDTESHEELRNDLLEVLELLQDTSAE